MAVQGVVLASLTMSTSSCPVHFLVHCIDAADGVSRAVLTLADELSRTHPVEVISLYRRGGGPAFPVSDRVRVTYLLGRPPPRPGGVPRPLGRRPRGALVELLARRRSRIAHGRGFPGQSLLTDVVVARKVRSVRSGVLVSTRPVLHLAAVRAARPGARTIGQDHLNYLSRLEERGTLDFITEAGRRGLDALVTLTPSDAVDYGQLLAGTSTVVVPICNPLAWPVLDASVTRARQADRAGPRVVVAAGRLVHRKGMGRLVRAFAPVARRHPDWELHIHGTGPLEPVVRRRIEREGLTSQVHLEGHTRDLASAFAQADVFAAASRVEGFPMVMLEAMSTGLPLVAMDCPRGPSDIVRDGLNGLLVGRRDLAGMTAALERLVTDADLRARLGEQALRDAREYAAPRIAARWEELLARLGTDEAAAVSRRG